MLFEDELRQQVSSKTTTYYIFRKVKINGTKQRSIASTY